MSITKIGLLTLATAVWGPGAAAESLLPDHLVRASEAGPQAHAGSARWLTAQAADRDPIDFLSTAAAGALARTVPAGSAPRPPKHRPAVDALAQGATPEEPAPAVLIEALDALGPLELNMSDHLSLALPGLAAGLAESLAATPSDAGRPRGSQTVGPITMNFMPVDSANAGSRPQPGAAARGRWALPKALSEQLTRYLFLAAAAALLAGAALHLTRWTRRSARPSLVRL